MVPFTEAWTSDLPRADEVGAAWRGGVAAWQRGSEVVVSQSTSKPDRLVGLPPHSPLSFSPLKALPLDTAVELLMSHAGSSLYVLYCHYRFLPNSYCAVQEH
jgi:hypothetical protein